MGRKLILTGTTVDHGAGAQKLAEIDVILPETGALLFLDATHPYDDWGTFDLNSSSGSVVLPNLAFAQAQALIPAGTTTTLGLSYVKEANFLNNGTTSKVERTVKGGLHVIFSQTQGDTTVPRSVVTYAGSAINSYLLTNKAHSFYLASWGRITRGALAYDAGTEPHMSMDGNSGRPIFYTRPGASGDTQYPTDATRLAHFGEGVMSTVGKTNTPIFQDIAVSNMSSMTTANFRPFILTANAGANSYKASSMVFYGFYLEDLTVSGRTYAQVNALVKAKYEKDVKTANGRYYGDTFTDPTTIP
jgi:hypothetical protein